MPGSARRQWRWKMIELRATLDVLRAARKYSADQTPPSAEALAKAGALVGKAKRI